MNEPSAHWTIEKIEDGKATLKNKADKRIHVVDVQRGWKEGQTIVDTFRNGANVLETLER